MRAAVNFDNQARIPAEKVGEVTFNWRLPDEFEAIEMPVAEVKPKYVLGGRCVGAQHASTICFPGLGSTH